MISEEARNLSEHSERGCDAAEPEPHGVFFSHRVSSFRAEWTRSAVLVDTARMLNAEVQPSSAPARYRLTVDDYYRLAEAGAFVGRRVELVEGGIFQMSPMGTPHKWAVVKLNQLLSAQLAAPWAVSVQCPLRLSAVSEPEPDLAIVRLPDVPGADFAVSDTTLIIEVADSSLEFDLGDKRSMYARAGVPEYWVLDLQNNEVVVHREPRGDDYESVSRHGRAETIESTQAPRETLRCSDALR